MIDQATPPEYHTLELAGLKADVVFPERFIVIILRSTDTTVRIGVSVRSPRDIVLCGELVLKSVVCRLRRQMSSLPRIAYLSVR